MVFSSSIFIHFFLPLLLFLYFLADKKYRNVILLTFSLLFYAWGEGRMINILLIMVTVNYGLGLGVGYLPSPYKKIILWVGVITNLSVLCYYKYILFLIENLGFAIHYFTDKPLLDETILLPLGISFYTFENISYLVDVYRKEVSPQKSWLKYTLYITFFPHLLAGPIVRYADIDKELGDREVSLDLFYEGSVRFISGLGKKLLIANPMGMFADMVFDETALSPFYVYWLGIVCYSLQIYFDFSGYSDMAIGMARMFGFHFLENFDMPYLAKSVTEFWRRWHISLSSWFRDYVYIPLGGNRNGKIKLIRNLSVVFFLTGFWHGASWNFIIWGAIHGLALIAERFFIGDWLKKVPSIISRAYLLLFILISWVFFKSEDLSGSLAFIRKMFSLNISSDKFLLYSFDLEMGIALLAGLLFSFGFQNFVDSKLEKSIGKARMFWVRTGFYFSVLALCIVYVSISTYNPFIYYRF